MKRKYQITLFNWFTRKKKDFILGETIEEANYSLKILRKKHSKIMWLKASPIHC